MISKCIDVYKNINIQIKNNSVEVSPCCLFPTQATDKLNFDNDPLLNLDLRNHYINDELEFPNTLNPRKKSKKEDYLSNNELFKAFQEYVRLIFYYNYFIN